MRTPAAGKRRVPGGSGRPVRAVGVAPGLALAALAALAGCAGRRPPAPPPAPPARPAPGYVALADSLDSVDGSVLAGKRIVLDPGHGGFFRGSIGVNGTTEAEVNLGVALRLRDLLAARGADVLVTRPADLDFLSPADSSLRADLAERVRIANAFRPDLFVSIHHNADPGGRHDVNETQTFYKLGDDGPSIDAAEDVHRALVRNLGIAANRILPGNFFVLRSSEAPALLTEASYLTDPDVEAKLKTPAAQQLEADALYLGITRFFMRRTPAIASLEVSDGEDTPPDTLVSTGRPLVAARVAGAFDRALVRIDGSPVPASLQAGGLTARPESPLAAGPHEAAVGALLAGEGSARTRHLRFTVRKEPARFSADAPWQPRWDGRGALAVRVRVTDADGLALPGSLEVRLRAPRRAAVTPRETTLVATDGVAWGYFRATRAPRRGTLRIVPAAAPGAAARRPRIDTLAVAIARDAAGPRTGFALEMPGGTPLRGAPGTSGPWPSATALNRDGFVALVPDSSARVRAPRVTGFRAWGADTTWPPRYVAIAGGALAGRRIALDPEGGGDDPAGTGPSGTRASTFNLGVARALAGMLEAAGAAVRLTRDDESAVSEVERVQAAEGFGAERYVRIGHAAAPPGAGHYYASAGGRRLARRIASAAVTLGLVDSLPVGESAKYTLAQVSAVAVFVSFGRIDDPACEARLLAPGRVREEAYALFVALAADWGAPADSVADTLEVQDDAGRPAPGALVTLGGALVLQAGPAGRVRFVRTESGPLEAACDDPRVRSRIVLIDSSRTHLLTGMR